MRICPRYHLCALVPLPTFLVLVCVQEGLVPKGALTRKSLVWAFGILVSAHCVCVRV